MSAQQIKSNINDLVSHIEDEDALNACFNAFTTIVKGNSQTFMMRATKANTSLLRRENGDTSSTVPIPLKHEEDVLSHDLSLAILANDIFKGAEPLSEAGEIAFEKAFKKALKKEPTLPNRF